MINMTVFITISLFLTCSTIYFGWRAFYLAGKIADSQEYIEELDATNHYMYSKIVESYNKMQEVDHKGSFEAEDEVGTTFSMLNEVITELKDLFNGEA